MASLITGLDAAARARERRARARGDRRAARAGRDPADVELLAAVKYVAARGARRARRGRRDAASARTARRTSRPRPTAHRRARSRWHFIGQLQSRKVKQIVPHVRADPLGRLATRRCAQLERHGTPDTRILVEVNVAGEEGKAGIAPDELGAFIAALARPRRRA